MPQAAHVPLAPYQQGQTPVEQESRQGVEQAFATDVFAELTENGGVILFQGHDFSSKQCRRAG